MVHIWAHGRLSRGAGVGLLPTQGGCETQPPKQSRNPDSPHERQHEHQWLDSRQAHMMTLFLIVYAWVPWLSVHSQWACVTLILSALIHRDPDSWREAASSDRNSHFMRAHGDSDLWRALGDSDFWCTPVVTFFQCDAFRVLDFRCVKRPHWALVTLILGVCGSHLPMAATCLGVGALQGHSWHEASTAHGSGPRPNSVWTFWQ